MPRDKLFGHGRAVPLDREAKVKLIHLAKCLMHPTLPGKAYGVLSAKAFAVFEALLYGFHNATTGRCFPSYERIAEKISCARSTVALAIKTLEGAKLLTWHNRIVRYRIQGIALLVRTSNAYQFPLLAPKSETRTETKIKIHLSEAPNPLEASLKRLEGLIKARHVT